MRKFAFKSIYREVENIVEDIERVEVITPAYTVEDEFYFQLLCDDFESWVNYRKSVLAIEAFLTSIQVPFTTESLMGSKVNGVHIELNLD